MFSNFREVNLWQFLPLRCERLSRRKLASTRTPVLHRLQFYCFVITAFCYDYKTLIHVVSGLDVLSYEVPPQP